MHQAWTALGQPVNQLRLELNKWPMVESMLRPQIKRRRQPLIEEHDRLPPTAASREAVSDVLFAQLHELLNSVNQDAGAHEHGCFPDIPLAQSLFLREVHAAKRCLAVLKPGERTRFLDVGCGAGLKVISAAPYFDRCAGLEYDPGYAALAAQLFRALPHDRCRAIQGDALAWERYGDHDVIYFFRPMRDDALLAQMERRIAAQVPPGTLLIAPYTIFGRRAAELGCAHVAGHVWLAGRSEAEAARLRREAELIGTDVLRTGEANIPLVWDPLVRASRLRGYEATLRARPPLKDENS
ncbi:class I SAM-dependent methyltransferase [Mangrovicoccus ximenensis]|uniref:class I SAM-dependent methyltransferase n=1 Tax=Mangrovicoccus ximenensis TaxID=1911570 RepID=UPI000D3D2A1B|nr:class I SAM-dependent methyltransferase [Mangrovicoccus ximenensis]